MSGKYSIGMVFDVWWELVRITKSAGNNYRYALRNKANGLEITIGKAALDRLYANEETVSHLIRKRIKNHPGRQIAK